ncbi:hypothetical protein AVEN_47081-1 [Araneus ventricosus]|uniref:Uncharacterized protein n=1 Tax=Araneus ventricosus TaxID=182803 RepID=A0A4Y2LDQ9_ARAVE|nr:hypothetical protein AVEN_47081-1 [Araneus ventricosus]
MSDLSLYESCLRKIAINLRDGIYKSCHENPFSVMSSKFVNDIMSAALDLERADGLRADDLEQLLTSGKLRELKMLQIDMCQELLQVLNSFISGCQELEVLHLTWSGFQVELISDIQKALGNLLRNSPNLKDLRSSIGFDLKALRNCKNLRYVKLLFQPQQHWYDFLAKENDQFQPHKYLEFFTICGLLGLEQIPCGDIVVILRHCPELTSLGFLESSEALSLLHNMPISPSELKLRHCFWRDTRRTVPGGNYVNHGGIKDAVLYCPMIEELEILVLYIETISCLRNLRNLVYLNITAHCDENIGAVFRYVLQEIGSRLKHLSFDFCNSSCSVDISIFLLYCPNLESLKIDGDKPLSASSVIPLPHLKRLSFKNSHCNDIRRIFPQLSGCNQLTDLFLENATDFDDETLYCFLKRNSLSNLKVAYLESCSLSELGFREFLLNAPRLEKIEFVHNDLHRSHFERVVRETSHKAICNKDLLSTSDEFFEKRSGVNMILLL